MLKKKKYTHTCKKETDKKKKKRKKDPGAYKEGEHLRTSHTQTIFPVRLKIL